MAIEAQKYIRKPLYVDAVRITATNFDEVVAWCQGEVELDEIPGKGTTKKYIKVRVHNPKNPRQTKAFIGDWLLYTVRGYKVYTNKAFRASFDLALPGDEIPQEEVVQVTEDLTMEDSPTAPPVDAGRFSRKQPRVLSMQDQNQMTHAEVQQMLRSGEAILEQDLPRV